MHVFSVHLPALQQQPHRSREGPPYVPAGCRARQAGSFGVVRTDGAVVFYRLSPFRNGKAHSTRVLFLTVWCTISRSVLDYTTYIYTTCRLKRPSRLPAHSPFRSSRENLSHRRLSMITTGIAFTRQRLFYTRQRICRV
jgi:hypothetical protein